MRTYCAANKPGGMGEHPVSRLMAETVIDALKVIQIDLNNGKRLSLLMAALYQYARPLKQCATVIQHKHIADHLADNNP